MPDQEARGGTLIAGGGFAGAYVARLLGDRGSTIVSADNFMLFTPMLPEAASGTLAPAQRVRPARAAARRRPDPPDVPAFRPDPGPGDRPRSGAPGDPGRDRGPGVLD